MYRTRRTCGVVLMAGFEKLQAGLGRAWGLNRPGVGVDHVLVALPSYSVGESLLSYYAERIPALDGRLGLTAIGRTPEHARDLYEAAKSAVSRTV
jgi:hypothetical protein